MVNNKIKPFTSNPILPSVIINKILKEYLNIIDYSNWFLVSKTINKYIMKYVNAKSQIRKAWYAAQLGPKYSAVRVSLYLLGNDYTLTYPDFAYKKLLFNRSFPSNISDQRKILLDRNKKWWDKSDKNENSVGVFMSRMTTEELEYVGI